MQVNIYTYSQTRSLRVVKPGESAAGFVLEAITRTAPATLTETYLLADLTEEANWTKAELLILIRAMKHMNRKADITVFTENRFVAQQFQSGNVSKWQQSGWKNAKGKEVTNQQQWAELLQLFGESPVSWKVGEHHEYSAWLKKEVEEDRNFLKGGEQQ